MSKKQVLIIVFFAFLILGLYSIYQRLVFFDGKLHIVFCNVGQGDGIFIRTPKGRNMVLDGGGDTKILSCLSRHMPFWEHTIDVVMLSHPHEDHLGGLIPVIKRYSFKWFVTEKLANKTASFTELMDLVKKSQKKSAFLYQGDHFNMGGGVGITILAPTKEFLEATSPEGDISESHEFSSLISKLQYGSFSILFTGDSQSEELKDSNPGTVTVLQIPHHGSRTGLTEEIIREFSPKLTVISVGKNKYGHPASETLNILKAANIKVLRTDINGEVEIVSDGTGFTIKK